MPTLFAAALLFNIVLFFTAEIWGVASTIEVYQLGLFAILCLLVGTAVLY